MTKDEEEYWRYRTERFHEDDLPPEPKKNYRWVLTTVVIVGVFVVLLLCSLLGAI
jgi:hypothetical protein